MPSKTILRLLALCVVAFALSTPLLAQQPEDSPSVAEAARRARQQKQDAAKPAHVIDNDAIPPSPAASTNTPVPASDANSAKPSESAAASAEASKPDADKGGDDKQKAEIDALKKEIADKLAKVTLEQRDISLAQDTFLSHPDHEHDNAGKEKLDSMQSDLTQLQAELTQLQAKLAALAPSDEKTPESPKP
jgi:hypothetical protein